MRTKLPDYHFVFGFAFVALGLLAKHDLPGYAGSLPIIQLPCAFFSAAFIPFSGYLALRGLVVDRGRRRAYVTVLLASWLFLIVLLSDYYFTGTLLEKTIALGTDNRLSGLLPVMVEKSRTLAKANLRETEAKWAYRLNGAIIAYPQEDNGLVYYIPNEEDKSVRQEQEKTELNVAASIAFLQKQKSQFGYLFLLYSSTYFAAFFVGGGWLVFKLPKDSDASAS